jgi:hypothetical protein
MSEMTSRQRDALLTQIARDIRAIRQAVAPENERPASTRKKDPDKLYGGTHS